MAGIRRGYIYRLERYGQVIEADATELELKGFDTSQVRTAVSRNKTYLGYTITVIGEKKVTDEVFETVEHRGEYDYRKGKLQKFYDQALAMGKSYAQAQLEETMGRVLDAE